jgi:glucose/arabinose dehydrogenase
VRRMGALLVSLVLVLGTSSLLVVRGAPSAAAAVPPGFTEVTAFSGLVNPTAVRFAPDGRIFVAEKRGTIRMYDGVGDTTPILVADLRTEVHNYWDRGLLGLAIHPDFPDRPYLYALYTFDGPIGGTAPRWGTAGADSDPCPTPPGPTGDGCVVSGKLVKLTLTGTTTTKQDLIHDWCQQYPSHTVGDVVFGRDGALYVSAGEGASFHFADYGQDGSPVNPCGDPPGGVGGAMTPPSAQGGALRAQDLRTPGDPVTLDGTVIRVSPDTGAALPDNPNAGAADPNAARIVAHGLRNPFRLTSRPGTDEVWLGDVGWNSWEEINRLVAPRAGIVNFGWPCLEGSARQAGYDAADLTLCEDLYAQATADTKPFFPYRHGQPLNSSDTCDVAGGSSASGLAFQSATGGAYPAEYNGALFVADYSRNCIWVMPKGADGLPDRLKARPFVSGATSPVDLEISPQGELYYAELNGGRIRRVVYGTGPTSCPVDQYLAEYFSGKTLSGTPVTRACVAAPIAQTWGAGAPPGVGPDNFSVRWSGTFDFPSPSTYTFTAVTDDGMRMWVDGVLVIDAWKDQSPTTYSASRALSAGEHTVRVEWYENTGSATARLGWSDVNAPPQPQISSPAGGTTWRVGDSLSFSGSATDPEDGPLPDSRLTWQLVLYHCPAGCHAHPLEERAGVATGSFTAPDHDFPSYLELRLTATDSGGRTTTVARRLDPRTVGVTLASQPAGLQLTLGTDTATAPFTRTLIQGSTTSLSAPSSQSLGGATYAFSGWSDGGAPSHNIVTGASAATYTATYTVTACPRGQYRAQYFRNATLSGTPLVNRCEAAPLDRNWGTGGPGIVGVDNFSARWTGSFSFTAGTKTFTAASDDGIRVWLDGVLIIDRWADKGTTTAVRSVTAGVHTVRVDYCERLGLASARVTW